jgi:hypothetical protein
LLLSSDERVTHVSQTPVLASNATRFQDDKVTVHWDLTHLDDLDLAAATLLWKVWQRRRPLELDLRPDDERLFRQLAALPPERTHLPNGAGLCCRRSTAAIVNSSSYTTCAAARPAMISQKMHSAVMVPPFDSPTPFIPPRA